MYGFTGFYDKDAAFLSRKDYYTNVLNRMTTVLHGSHTPHHTLSNSYTLDNHCGMTCLNTNTSSNPPLHSSSFLHFENYTLLFHGTLYNIDELKKMFQTSTLLETVLQGLIHYNTDFLEMMDGVFSLAFYNQFKNSLLLARDCFGVIPLFYSFINGTVVFSTKLKSILSYPGIEPVVKKEGLQELFGLGPAKNPESAIFDGIKEIKPGNYMRFSMDNTIVNQFWQLKCHEHEDDYATTLRTTKDLVISAVEKQMKGDSPICCFLSGGVDSSLVSAICSKELSTTDTCLTTYSFDFDDSEVYFKSNGFQPSLDRPYVDMMVDYLKTNHHYLYCDSQNQVDLLTDSVIAHDLPCMADIDSSLIYFCSKVAPSHKIVMTGECADEVFGGYPWMHNEASWTGDTFPWANDLTPRTDLLHSDLKQELNLEEFVKNSFENAVSEITPLSSQSEKEKYRTRIAYLNLRYFMQTLLDRMGCAGSYTGLEARVPFCDRKLVEYVFNIPWEMKAKDGIVKNVLREAFRGFLPDEILFRKKSPYPKTYHPEYENLLREKLKSCLLDTSPLLAIVDYTYLKRFIDSPKDYGKPWYGQLMAGPQMLAYLIQMDFWLREYKITIM